MTYTPKTSWQLARLAECADPDAHDGQGFSADQGTEAVEGSPGAKFLRSIEDGAMDSYYDERPDDLNDTAHEISDGAVPVYTHELWKTFVDLAAYQEDISGTFGEVDDDLSKVAATALYMIGERLALALLEERWDEDDDDDEEE